ncbi:predicted protein [Histoplasma capsulatum G186AR]|uniref:Uncharacterized protein n=1 Tax=Ajellomyces capsulatus (strain G186AR / H82 / ATCC MYA-2454 / RMSCC 2432) TaxID=447093 RepID=C0NDN6_AJECG|nr:uncharacterized protein HCBG_01979 [Histoplasma capsulatum G186AR]EEH10334.1 predicted protein [Histoplasma capsulatum G186AR]
MSISTKNHETRNMRFLYYVKWINTESGVTRCEVFLKALCDGQTKNFNSDLMEVEEARYIKPIKSSEILLRGCLKDDEEYVDSIPCKKPSSCAGANLLAKRRTLSTESYSKSLADTGKDPGIPQDEAEASGLT